MDFQITLIDLIKTFIEPCLNSLLSNPSSPNLEWSSCNLLILDGLNLNGKRTLLALTEGFSSLKGIWTFVDPNFFVGNDLIHLSPPGINSVSPSRSSSQATANLKVLPCPSIFNSKDEYSDTFKEGLYI